MSRLKPDTPNIAEISQKSIPQDTLKSSFLTRSAKKIVKRGKKHSFSPYSILAGDEGFPA
jgi:hypothetical protein